MDALIYILLALTSIVGLAFIVERGLALRWGKVVPPAVTMVLAKCRTPADARGGPPRLAEDGQRGCLADRRAP